MERLGIKAKVMNDGDIVGFVIVSENGTETVLDKNSTIDIIKSGRIENWEVIKDEDGEEHVYSDNIPLQSLPNEIKSMDYGIELISITCNGEQVDLLDTSEINPNESIKIKLKMPSGKVMNCRLNQLWQLVKLGCINGLKCDIKNKQRVLIVRR